MIAPASTNVPSRTVDSAVQPARRIYVPRQPDTSVLYEVVSSELDGFLLAATKRGRAVPPFIERTFRDYLACGMATAGFVRVHCDTCGHDRILPFSCQRRGVCPSCSARRMADAAANLVDFVLPEVGVRQWVLTLPFALRYRLAYDRSLLTPVLGAFLRTLFRSHRRRVHERHGVRGAKCGAVTFVQRAGGSLNLNVHLHVLVLEGAYETPPAADRVRFLPLPAPSDEEVGAVLADAAGRVARQLESRGLGADCDAAETDELAREDPLLAKLYAASVEGRVAFGPRAGEPTTRTADGQTARPIQQHPQPLCAAGHGLSLHAGVYIPGSDRERLERVCRYTARGALTIDRMRKLEDGRISYRMRHAWRDGTTHVVMEPADLIARLAALIPPPRQHQVRYAGILAPGAAWRDHVVPCTEPASSNQCSATSECPSAPKAAHTLRPHPWAELMRRVFSLDVLRCPRCESRMRVITEVYSEKTACLILNRLGLAQRAPPTADPQPDNRLVTF